MTFFRFFQGKGKCLVKYENSSSSYLTLHLNPSKYYSSVFFDCILLFICFYKFTLLKLTQLIHATYTRTLCLESEKVRHYAELRALGAILRIQLMMRRSEQDLEYTTNMKL
jgi:hypothetical protein